MSGSDISQSLPQNEETNKNPEPYIIVLRKKRTIKSVLFQHAIEGVAILVSALSILSEHTDVYPALTILKAAVAAGLIIAIAIEFVHIRKGHLSKFPAVELLAGLVFLLESIDKFFEGHVPISIAWLIVSMLTIISGFIKPSILRIRRIVFDSKGIFVKTSAFGKFGINWSDLKLIKMSNTIIELITKDGDRKELKLVSFLHSQEVVDKFNIGLEKFKVPLETTERYSDLNNHTLD